jgi:hypothetical protein
MTGISPLKKVTANCIPILDTKPNFVNQRYISAKYEFLHKNINLNKKCRMTCNYKMNPPMEKLFHFQ